MWVAGQSVWTNCWLRPSRLVGSSITSLSDVNVGIALSRTFDSIHISWSTHVLMPIVSTSYSMILNKIFWSNQIRIPRVTANDIIPRHRRHKSQLSFIQLIQFIFITSNLRTKGSIRGLNLRIINFLACSDDSQEQPEPDTKPKDQWTFICQTNSV